jgi:hypothetical protein
MSAATLRCEIHTYDFRTSQDEEEDDKRKDADYTGEGKAAKKKEEAQKQGRSKQRRTAQVHSGRKKEPMLVLLRKQMASREDDAARKKDRANNLLKDLREFKKDDAEVEVFIEAMKTQIARPKLTGGLKSKQDAIDEMNKYIKALEMWGKFKMASLDHEEAMHELATAKAYYESAKEAAVDEEDDSDGSKGGY